VLPLGAYGRVCEPPALVQWGPRLAESATSEKRRIVWRVGVVGLALLLASVSCTEPPAGPSGFSLLAVGDTGAPPDDAEGYPHLLDVGAAMAAEHRERPVDALVLLGDNFYPDGLRSPDLLARIRATVVRPFCPFLALTAPRSAEVADACGNRGAEHQSIPLLVVLGNHDYGVSESPELQRSTIPSFVSNWRLSPALAEAYELGSGVSLIAVDSERIVAGEDVAPLRDVLRAARGPWRILAAHRPALVLRQPGTNPTPDQVQQLARQRSYAERVLGAIKASGVGVHLFLAGHEHNLQILTGDPPAPPLHVIAGGGSDPRSIRGESPRRMAGFKSLGFVRIDLVGEGDGARLIASLYRVPTSIERFFGDRRLAARWSVDAAGRVAGEGAPSSTSQPISRNSYDQSHASKRR